MSAEVLSPSGVSQAALMVLLLEEEVASRLLADLSAPELRRLAAEMAQLDHVDPAQIAQAIAAFADRAEPRALPGGAAPARIRHLLEGAVGPVKADGVMRSVGACEDPADTGPLALLRWLSADAVLSLLADEYPPSALATITRLVERAGNSVSHGGSVTGLYTVLADGDDHNDPVVDTARAILDGHIVLSRQIAQRGRYPAIDVPASLSRVMADIASPDHLAAARELRALIAAYDANRDLLMMGAYTRRGDLSVTASGLLVNGEGRAVLGEGGPITVPLTGSVTIAEDGAVTVAEASTPDAKPVEVARIKLASPVGSAVAKGLDGLFRVENGGILPSDAAARVKPGYLEQSNVKPTEVLVEMIDQQRLFAMRGKLVGTARELDESGAQLMRLA